jgi:hypothetical protein
MASPHTRIDVLKSVRVKTPPEFGDAHLLSQSLGAPEKMVRETATSLHCRELADLLRTAAVLHVLYTARRTSLAGMWDFSTQQHKRLGDALKAMRTTAHVFGGVHRAIASMTRAIENLTGDRELSGVWTTTIWPLVLYSDPQVAKSTEDADFDVKDLQYGDRPVSLYGSALHVMLAERCRATVDPNRFPRQRRSTASDGHQSYVSAVSVFHVPDKWPHPQRQTDPSLPSRRPSGCRRLRTRPRLC